VVWGVCCNSPRGRLGLSVLVGYRVERFVTFRGHFFFSPCFPGTKAVDFLPIPSFSLPVLVSLPPRFSDDSPLTPKMDFKTLGTEPGAPFPLGPPTAPHFFGELFYFPIQPACFGLPSNHSGVFSRSPRLFDWAPPPFENHLVPLPPITVLTQFLRNLIGPGASRPRLHSGH